MTLKNLLIIFFIFIITDTGSSQDEPVLSGDAFLSLSGVWSGEYIIQQENGRFDTVEADITAEISPMDRGASALFTVIYPDGQTKADRDTMLISEDGRTIDMGNLWTITEIMVDKGDTILMLERKEQTDNNEIHYLRSILRAGPDKFAILTAVRRKAGEDYFLEEQYRFTRR